MNNKMYSLTHFILFNENVSKKLKASCCRLSAEWCSMQMHQALDVPAIKKS